MLKLKDKCEKLTPNKRKWVLIAMFVVTAGMFVYNILTELL